MLQINVAQQLKAHVGAVRKYDIDGIVNIEDNESQVRGSVTLTRTDRGILVTGTVQTAVQLMCSRCLGGFNYPLALNLEEEFFPTIDIVTGTRLSLPEEPGAFTIDERNILDLTEAVRQYALLSIPMKPLCRKDCAGLCPSCGSNLNEGACGCPPKEVDARWSTLLELTLPDGSGAKKEKGKK